MWKVADLFCGAGGFSEGFRQMGFEISFALDHWKPAVRTFRKNHPHAEGIEEDAVCVDPSILPRVDVVIGSPPCSPFSYSNGKKQISLGLGLSLVRRFVEFVEEMRPRVWFMENVPPIKRFLDAVVPPRGYNTNDAEHGTQRRGLRGPAAAAAIVLGKCANPEIYPCTSWNHVIGIDERIGKETLAQYGLSSKCVARPTGSNERRGPRFL